MKRFFLAALLLSCRSYVYDRIYPESPYLPNVEPPEGLSSLDAKSCGLCHQEIYQEWSSSLHKVAWTDPLFQADFTDLDEPYMCAYCHAPVGQQRPTIVTGLASLRPLRAKEDPNPLYDPSLHEDGVSCVACHLREKKLIGPNNLSAADAPHATSPDPSLSSAETCKPCHYLKQSYGADLKRPIIDTYAEWQKFRELSGAETCADCHMPAAQRASFAGGPIRGGRKHVFLGHNDADFVKTAITVTSVKSTKTTTSAQLDLSIENKTGHNFPTGEPGRYLIVAIESYDASGTLLSTTEVARLQREIDEHGFIEKSDNTLAPRETRALRAELPEAARLRLVLTYYIWDPTSAVGKSSGLNTDLSQTIFSQELGF